MAGEVTVLTVAFGESEQVEKWYRAWAGLGFRCVVCDNRGELTDAPCGLTVLPFAGNTGFGRGVNRAAEEAGTPLILVTNPDTLPGDESSVNLFLKGHGKGMVSGARTTGINGEQVYSTGVWPTINWIRKQLFKPAETLWRKERYHWLQGSLMLFNRDEFSDLQGFSPNFPLYFEDTDICARAVSSGLRMRYEPQAEFFHYSGTGSSGSTALRLACFHWGMSEFFRVHRKGEYSAARRLILLKCSIRAAGSVFCPERARGYLKGFSSVLKGTAPELPGSQNVR